jgi:hypothetical protein
MNKLRFDGFYVFLPTLPIISTLGRPDEFIEDHPPDTRFSFFRFYRPNIVAMAEVDGEYHRMTRKEEYLDLFRKIIPKQMGDPSIEKVTFFEIRELATQKDPFSDRLEQISRLLGRANIRWGKYHTITVNKIEMTLPMIIHPHTENPIEIFKLSAWVKHDSLDVTMTKITADHIRDNLFEFVAFDI